MFHSIFFFITLAFTLFMADISLYFFYHTQFFYFVLIAYIFELLRIQISSRLIFWGALLALESFIFYSSLWAPLSALIPLTILEIHNRHNFYQSWIYTVAIGGIFFGAQMLVIEPFLLGLPMGIAYTFFKLCANLLVLGILSLKNFNQNKRDNRGTRF